MSIIEKMSDQELETTLNYHWQCSMERSHKGNSAEVKGIHVVHAAIKDTFADARKVFDAAAFTARKAFDAASKVADNAALAARKAFDAARKENRHALKVIIIDDNPVDLFYLDRVFQHRRYQVQAYSDPVLTPLYKCKRCPCSLEASGCPDVIVSDVIMPVINGVELLKSFLQKGCRCRHLALISGNRLMEPELHQIVEYGARFFTKPLDLDDFYEWLDHVEQEIGEQHSGDNPPCKASDNAKWLAVRPRSPLLGWG